MGPLSKVLPKYFTYKILQILLLFDFLFIFLLQDESVSALTVGAFFQ